MIPRIITRIVQAIALGFVFGWAYVGGRDDRDREVAADIYTVRELLGLAKDLLNKAQAAFAEAIEINHQSEELARQVAVDLQHC